MPIDDVDQVKDGSSSKPINREPDMATLISSFITKQDHYDRNHGAIQHKSSANHIVTVDGLVSRPLKLTTQALESDFPQHTVVCALQCAGNRRHSMRTRIKEVQGVDWFDAAVMNVSFTGPRVRDILLAAGVPKSDFEQDSQPPDDGIAGNGKDNTSKNVDVVPKHVQFASYGGRVQEDDWYGGSIPFERALDPDMDVILALKMNGNTLPSRHGYPVRAIVPGVLGARSVKWLDRITVANEESPNFYQQHDYKVLPPDATDKDSAEKYWSTTPAMLEMPINACVAVPTAESTVVLPKSDLIEAKGYAVPHGSDGPVVRVQVSGDEGATWVDAEIDNGGEYASKWSWVLWNVKIKMERGPKKKIFAKATDAGGNTQEEERSTWNLRGVAYNGYEAAYNLTIV